MEGARFVDQTTPCTLLELEEFQCPDNMKRALACQTEAELMAAPPPASQLRHVQSLVEIGVDRNATVAFPAPPRGHARAHRWIEAKAREPRQSPTELRRRAFAMVTMWSG